MSETTPLPQPSGDGRGGLGAVWESLRAKHWIKNGFVVAPMLFSGRFVEPVAWGLTAGAVGAFCMLSSGVYLINDVRDRRDDRAHPLKCNRPIASGRLSVAAGIVLGVLLLVGGLATAAGVVLTTPEGFWSMPDLAPALGGWGLLVWAACYGVLNMLYSFWLKQHPIIDVIAVALGFVLRAMAGAAAIAVPISPWLVICTFALCLFIALTKRRAEVLALGASPEQTTRRVNLVYSRTDLELMLTVSASMALLTYALYSLAPSTVERFGSAHMVWTVPLAVYGGFRFSHLSRHGYDDPVKVLLGDRVMWIVVVMYVVLVGLIVKLGSTPAVRTILEPVHGG